MVSAGTTAEIEVTETMKKVIEALMLQARKERDKFIVEEPLAIARKVIVLRNGSRAQRIGEGCAKRTLGQLQRLGVAYSSRDYSSANIVLSCPIPSS